MIHQQNKKYKFFEDNLNSQFFATIVSSDCLFIEINDSIRDFYDKKFMEPSLILKKEIDRKNQLVF